MSDAIVEGYEYTHNWGDLLSAFIRQILEQCPYDQGEGGTLKEADGHAGSVVEKLCIGDE